MASASRFAPPATSLAGAAFLRRPPRLTSSSSILLPSPAAKPLTGIRSHYRPLGSSPVADDDDEDPFYGEKAPSFDLAVALFNAGDFNQCHDHVEELWYGAEEPARTLLHGILQCAVGLHHLFNQNHRGAMMELGEGLCKLRKLDFDGGPFREFEAEVAEVLEFVYRTQKELAACTEELCLAMDGSERSYQLLGSFAAGQPLYSLDMDTNGIACIVFCPGNRTVVDKPSSIKVPTLRATEEHFRACEYKY